MGECEALGSAHRSKKERFAPINPDFVAESHRSKLGYARWATGQTARVSGKWGAIKLVDCCTAINQLKTCQKKAESTERSHWRSLRKANSAVFNLDESVLDLIGFCYNRLH
jgi:hypothetical protein